MVLHCHLPVFVCCHTKAASALGDAAVFTESASVAYHDAHSQAGAALLAARNAFNMADAAFNEAKTSAFQALNAAKRSYSQALARYDLVMVWDLEKGEAGASWRSCVFLQLGLLPVVQKRITVQR